MATLKNLYMDSTNDLSIENHNLRLTNDTTEWISIKLTIALRAVLGEWFVDNTFGVPYFTDVLGKKSDINEVNALFYSIISDVKGVKEIDLFETEFDSIQRLYTLNFHIIADDNTYVKGSITL